ncbi:MAG: TlpA family protein disulfide reductase [Alphaproteobacteria bacterium]|nr:TlpA family protein disulfide reductase [Alphaproteobacteria bacterium]MCL2506037.1 TlpA family protein disulfide reductase [Alphaproteobacteria bacterium]
MKIENGKLGIMSFLAVLVLCFMATAANAMPDVVFEDEYGKQYSLGDYKGSTIIIIGWTSWCPACIKEISELNAKYNELSQNSNLVILAISMDSSSDAVAAFRQRYNINNVPLFIDKPRNIANAFGFTKVPYGVVLDPYGEMIARFTYGETGNKSLLEALVGVSN